MLLDTRAISTPVYSSLNKLYKEQIGNPKRLDEQRNQAVELYTYLSTWGLLRLKAEEKALKKQEGKKEVVEAFFKTLEEISGVEKISGPGGLATLADPTKVNAEIYLGLVGLGLQIAREYTFWATAIYNGVGDT
jgi:hypothetical protein